MGLTPKTVAVTAVSSAVTAIVVSFIIRKAVQPLSYSFREHKTSYITGYNVLQHCLWLVEKYGACLDEYPSEAQQMFWDLIDKMEKLGVHYKHKPLPMLAGADIRGAMTEYFIGVNDLYLNHKNDGELVRGFRRVQERIDITLNLM